MRTLKLLIASAAFLSMLGLSGCIVVPGYDDDGYGYRHDGYGYPYGYRYGYPYGYYDRRYGYEHEGHHRRWDRDDDD